MGRDLSWEKELDLAEAYAKDGPGEWPEEYLTRCLKNAEEKAKLQGRDVSLRIAKIKEVWQSKL